MKQWLQFFGLSADTPPDETAVDQVEPISAPPPGPKADHSSQLAVLHALASMVTHAWKAKQRLTPRTQGEEPGDEQRRLLRHLDAILDEASSIGISYKDRVNQVFDYGLPEKVVASEPQPGLNKPVVKETLRPTITWNGQILVHGEIILATPPQI